MARTDLIQRCDEVLAAFTDEVTADEALQAMEFIAALKEVARQLSVKVEAAAIAWIEKNGDLQKGDVRYYVGPNRTTKCRDIKDAIAALLKATGGDLDAMADCLSAGAFKPGACRDVLAGDVFADCFEVRETTDLKTGKPTANRLQKHDPKWLKGAKSGAPQRAPAGADGPSDEEG